jgi:membrane-associated phospholipid phosphatase
MIAQKVASLISILSHQAVFAILAFLILLYPGNSQDSVFLFGVCIFFGTIIPLAMLHELSARGRISDFYVSERKQRTIPFACAILSYLAGGMTLTYLRAPPIVTALMLCYAGNTAIMMLITLRWKISVHASGVAGPIIVLIYGLGSWAAIFLAVLFPVGWARIRLNAHSPKQILVGALLTIATTWIQLRIYLAML